MVEITRKDSRSGSVYSFEYDPTGPVPPILTISDLGGGVPVMENLVAVTKEMEQRIGRNIRFFPVLILTKGQDSFGKEAYQVLYSDDRADDFTASVQLVDGSIKYGIISSVECVWCNEHFEDLAPEEIRNRLLNPLMSNVLGRAVREGVRQFNLFLTKGKDERERRKAGNPYPTSLAHGHHEAFTTAAACLWSAFSSVQADCMAAIEKVARDGVLSGYNNYATAHLDAFLLALRERLGHPILVRDYTRMDGLNAGIVEVYKEGICPPPTADINSTQIGGSYD